MIFYTSLNESIKTPRAVFYDARLETARIRQLEPGWEQVPHWEPVQAGERLKSTEGIFSLWERMERLGLGRGDVVAGVGGGTVSDALGFAASTWKRGGMTSVWMPTTLVGMIDAAHGGKTAANFRGTKNILGTYQLPTAVLVHPEWLTTLPQEELLSGWFELAKHALLECPEAWAQLAAIPSPTLADVVPRIEASIATKLRIASEDPFESGLRKALNFGHTVGHALEAWSHAHDTPLTHGRCVGHGMRCALRYSAPEALNAADAALVRWLGGAPPPVDARALWSYMLQDKKNEEREVREVVLDGIGRPRWDVTLRFDTFMDAWTALQAPEA